MAGDISPVPGEPAVAHVDTRGVGAEGAGVIFRGVVVEHAGLEQDRGRIDPDRAAAGDGRISDVVLEGAGHEADLDVRDADATGVELFRGESIAECDSLKGHRLRRRESENSISAITGERHGRAGSRPDSEASAPAVQVGINCPAAGWRGIGAGGQFDDAAIGNLIERLLQSGRV